ncbi:uncharacterized protein Dyak_GE18580, isoform B [Drosophila yakuba]|uniref:Uncharacterized protein, isoform B n=1 Tax=Drosophila yakuba TaxID=7245 RepID=A0A0R1DK51_DROYA|nr:uncharacterized protein Dyak_GE18580, isoform B [Drosophila yakuba]
MINYSTAIGFVNSQKGANGCGCGCGDECGCECGSCEGNIAKTTARISEPSEPTASENVAFIGGSGNSQLSAVIENLSHNSDVAAALSFHPAASPSSLSLSPEAAAAASALTLFAGGAGAAAGSSSTTTHRSTHKSYPPINSAYWLPSSHPSPYAVPERKLFVGMLNKKLNENDVRKLFEVHGAIEECTVLRDQNGQSKGCAFVTFATKHAAISAIKVTLSQNKIMEGCTSPLVVKFADTQKEKEQKKIQQIQANLWNLASNINIPLGQTATSVTTPILPNPPQQPSPVLGADAITPASIQLLQQLQAVGLQQQLLQALTGLGAQQSSSATDTSAVAAAGLLTPMTVQNLAAIAAMTQPSLSNAAAAAAAASSPGSAQLTNTAALLWSDPNPLASAYMSTAAGLPQFGSASALSTSPLASVALSAAAAAAAGKQIEGPEGCNLFIYHLPQEFTDTDLASTFLPFGNVISAKVFIDKQTSLSKCFGFVSFDNPDSAQVAIKAMNGFQVGTKRLKVQLKKPKDSKPY